MLQILPVISPPLYVASKRRHGVFHQATRTTNITEGNSTISNAPPADIDYGEYLSSLSLSSERKKRITHHEWLELVLQATEEMKWKEMYYDEKVNRNYMISPGNPNRVIDELLSLCPIPDEGEA